MGIASTDTQTCCLIFHWPEYILPSANHPNLYINEYSRCYEIPVVFSCAVWPRSIQCVLVVSIHAILLAADFCICFKYWYYKALCTTVSNTELSGTSQTKLSAVRWAVCVWQYWNRCLVPDWQARQSVPFTDLPWSYSNTREAKVGFFSLGTKFRNPQYESEQLRVQTDVVFSFSRYQQRSLSEQGQVTGVKPFTKYVHILRYAAFVCIQGTRAFVSRFKLLLKQCLVLRYVFSG